MHPTKIHQGVGSAYDLRITVPSSDTFDPSTPDGVTFVAHRENGSTVTLLASMINQSASAVTVVHSWDPGEPAALGDWDVWVVFTYPSGPPSRSDVYQFTVVPPYQQIVSS
jgi:hypothetical protein